MWHEMCGTGSGSIAADGFRLTPVGASIGTMAIGLLAVVVASYWNYRTLLRVEERYQNDLRESHADSVREAILELVHQTTAWAWAVNDYRGLVNREFVSPVTMQDEASAIEKRVREEERIVAAAQRDLRRSLWAAQLVIDDAFVREKIIETVHILQIWEAGKNEVRDWKDLPAVVERLHEKRVKTNEKVDAILDYALNNLQKKHRTDETNAIWGRRCSRRKKSQT